MSKIEINLKEITQKYDDRTIIDNVSLDLTGPSINMLLGPSGCGKSTLLHMMGGARPLNVKTPTNGDVKINGEACFDVHEDAIMVFQSYANRPDLTVWENCVYPFRLALCSKIEKSDWTQRIEEMLKAVGLSDKKKHYPSQLSGGQNQRLALARALSLRPKIILMDEPFGALDPKTREDMQDLLISLYEKYPCLVVFVTHDVTEAICLGDRIMVMSPSPAKIADDFRVSVPRQSRREWLKTDDARQMERRILDRLHEVDGHGQVRITV